MVTKQVVKRAVKRPAVKKATGQMTPLEKARLARASGAAKKPAKKIAWTSNADAKATFQAPEDFRACFYEIKCKTEADGLFGSKITGIRIQGSYDRAPDKNRRPVHKFDPRTLMGIAARLGAATFVSKQENRLPANTLFTILFRTIVNKDGELRVSLKFIKADMTKNSVTKTVELPKAHPVYRRIRRAIRPCNIAAAFISALQPPKLGRGETD